MTDALPTDALPEKALPTENLRRDVTLVDAAQAPENRPMVKIHNATSVPLELLWSGHVIGSALVVVAVILIIALKLPRSTLGGTAVKER